MKPYQLGSQARFDATEELGEGAPVGWWKLMEPETAHHLRVVVDAERVFEGEHRSCAVVRQGAVDGRWPASAHK